MTGRVTVVGLGPGRADWCTPAVDERAGDRHRPRRVRARTSTSSRPPSPGAAPPIGQPGGGRPGRPGARPRGGGRRRRRRVVRRPWRVRDGQRRAGAARPPSRPLAGRRGRGAAGDHRGAGRSPAASARRSGTTSASSPCPTSCKPWAIDRAPARGRRGGRLRHRALQPEEPPPPPPARRCARRHRPAPVSRRPRSSSGDTSGGPARRSRWSTLGPARPGRGRHEHGRGRRLVVDAGPRPTRGRRRSTRRGPLVPGACPIERVPDTRPPRRSTVATVSAAGWGGRSTITTRRPRRRAATSFASAAVPPAFFVTTVSTRWRVSSATSVVDVERAAVEHDLGVGEDGVERFDGPHEEPQPRGAGEGLQALATEGEEDALGTEGREHAGGGRERRGVVPAVARERGPRRAEQPAVGDAGRGRGVGGVERHDLRRRGAWRRRAARCPRRSGSGRGRPSPPKPPRRTWPGRSTGWRVSPASELVTSWPSADQAAGQLGGLGRAREDQHPSHGFQGRRAIQGLVASRLGPAAWYVPPQDAGNTGANPGLSSNCHRGAIPHHRWSRPRRGWKAEGERRSGSQDTCVCEPNRSTLGDVTR